ncbi:zinc finger protein 569 [Melitaea cinxia]|uniref:zinc finger protein 569 n=1 Tax=Melitaea cinxia TaxID=113334 RepID=UPI001E27135B|nr:zinc finger protein 569 [Melitaea cinxia]
MNKICRICLEEGVLSSIFAKNYPVSLCEMIEFTTKVKIRINDGLPEQICSNCVYKLGVAYHFKQSCESADLRLREYLALDMPNRVKDAIVMTDPIVVTQRTIIKKCKCKNVEQKKTSSNYKKKPESEKLKRGPKPKQKQDHSCYQCDKQFKCKAQLEIHVRTHTGDKPFVCMFCPRRFTQKHNLTIHLRMHTGEKPFQCDVCSKTFSAQGNLQTHLKIHTGQKDHVCSLCKKSFITSSELTRHMFKHREVKGFKCDICGAAYVHNRDLKKHHLRKHKISETSKAQNDYSNSNNIDIIGVDETKSISVPVGNDVPDNKIPISSVNRNHHLYENKDLKHDHQYASNIPCDSLHCSVCGEIFHYMAPLAQHYLIHHKGI